MKRILFLLFLFALSINVILAQVATISIETPSSNGLSNNQVDDFDVNTDGTILNNSATGGTAQLGNTAVAANPNITAGSEADLILFQVTGSSNSGLNGTIEVFGGEAGLIIANPNGIDCDGCGFINTNRVDLVTGTANFSGDDLTGFSIDGSSTLTVSGSGFLSDAVADELKLESQNIIINAQVRANDSLEIIVNNYTQSGAIDIAGDLSIQVSAEASLDDNASIKAKNLFFSAYDLYNQADITITENATFDIGNDFWNGFYFDGIREGGDIIADSFNVTAGGYFINQYSATISADSFNVTTDRNFYNWGSVWGSVTISADSFNVTAGYNFYNWDRATINADSFNVTAGDDFYNWDRATINANDFNAAGYNFNNRDNATINADSFNVTAGSFFFNYDSATINADSFNVTAGDDFNNYDSATINADNFNVTAGTYGNFYNYDSATINADTVTIEVTNFDDDISNTATISSDNLNIILTDDFTHTSTSITGFSFNNLGVSTDGTFTNNATINPTGNLTITANSFDNTGGVLNAATFALSVAGDFDYANNGTITTTTAYNLNVGGDFSNNDSANDFTWGANDNLTVLGNAFVTAASFNNSGIITVTNNGFDITATDFNNSGTISANTTLNTTVSSTVSGSFNNTGGVVSADTVSLSVAGDFDYVADFDGTIDFNSINLNVGGDFSNNDSANDFTWGENDILTVSGNADITADSYTQNGAIDVAGVLTINVESDFDYVADFDGTIDFNSINLNVGGDFSNNDASNDFVWNASDSLVVLGSASVTTDSFNNSGTISANNFNATVNTFVNEASATITAGECNIVHTTSYIDNGTVTCLDSATGDATVINIARTLSNGISNNSYATFHIPSNGVIFNNSVSDATSQLAGFISANPNYTNGNAATLILAQITGNNISILFGALEVFGAEAGVIIANPNGIICNACSFLNASRVDLVTGSYNIPAGIYDVNEAAGINLSNGLDASSVAVLNIQAGSFTNTGGLKANSFNLYVAGNFDYADRGNVTASSFNLDVDGNFSNNDSNNNFILDSLTVSGNADITTNNYIQSGAIDVAGALTINANSYTYNSPNSDFVLAENDSLSISSGDFTITANNYIQFGTLEILEVYGALVIDAKRNFSNSGSIITTGSLEITARHTAINQGSIVSNSLDLTTDDFFRNLTGGDISVDSLNITAGGKVTNIATINAGTLNIIANNDSSRTNDTTGFYVANRGNITATTLNIAAVDNFYNRGNITATDFNITRAKAIFFLNKEIDSFYAAGHIYDGGNISLSGDSSFRADGGIIENYGNIDLGDFNLDISADSFTNHTGANVTANTVNLAVTSYINDGTIDAVVINDTTSDQ